MKINLPNGRQIQIGIQIANERPILQRPLPKQIKDKPFRSTTILLTLYDQNGNTIGQLTGTSYCNPLDCFERAEGRKKAMRRLFAQNQQTNLLNKETCHTISPYLLHGSKPK